MVWQLCKKLNIELPYSPNISLIGIDPRGAKNHICSNKTFTLVFIAAPFIRVNKYDSPNIYQPMNE